MLTKLNRCVFRYEKHILDAKAERDQLAEVQKGTESFQAEIKAMNEKFASYQDDLFTKDALIEKRNKELYSKAHFLYVDLDDKKAKIKKWGAFVNGLKREKERLEVDLTARDKKLKDAHEELSRTKRTANADRVRDVQQQRRRLCCDIRSIF